MDDDCKQMSEALDAIHDETLRLLQDDLPEDVEEGLELILSMARYKQDVRNDEEVQRSKTDESGYQRIG